MAKTLILFSILLLLKNGLWGQELPTFKFGKIDKESQTTTKLFL